jgi:hypothetical protein
MKPTLTPEAAFEVDLELPYECWERKDLDEDLAALFRLTYIAGYVAATKDAKSGKIGSLISRVARRQQETVA